MDHSNAPRKRRLSDILDGQADQLRQQWENTEAAGEFAPLPSGCYIAHVQSAELFSARTTGTPGVKLTFRIAEGEHVGRLLWDDLWLTPAALPQTKRDCLKLGIQQLDQLENGAIPPGRIRCKIHVGLRTDDSGEQFNRVKRFDVLGIDEPQADAFTPSDDAEGDESFDPAQLEKDG